MPKYKMYVSIMHQQVNFYPDDSPWEYEVEIAGEFVPIFHRLFHQMDRLEFLNFLRSHLPYFPYHFDHHNHEIDLRTMKLYALVHEFSNDDTRRFIEQLPYFR